MQRKISALQNPVDRSHVVLIGAGTAHLVLLDGMRMGKWLGDASVTLVSRTATVLYSGSVPACLQGEVSRDSITVDLVSLCQRAGARLVVGLASHVDPAAQTVKVEGRDALLRYDWLAIAAGAEPVGDAAMAVPSRPFEGLLDTVASWETGKRIAVIGGGASGSEIAAALAARGQAVTIFESGPRLLQEQAASVSRRFLKRLVKSGVTVRTGTPVKTFRDGQLQRETGAPETFDGAVWATGSAAPAWLKAHAAVLPLSDDGFLRIEATLRVVGHRQIFATGDGAVVEKERYAKNGVVAVHQGRILATNLDRAIRRRPLRRFRLKRPTLWILNAGRGQGVLGFGPLVWSGKGARAWKRRLDGKWMERWRVPTPSASEMLCEGCGGKAPAATLVEALASEAALLPAFEDVGMWQTDDGFTAGSVDQLTSWTTDPYRFGEIAVLHALSDTYAKGLGPEAVLVAVTLPRQTAKDLRRALEEVDRGIRAALAREGVRLAGGHTTLGEKWSLAVTVVAASPEPTLLLRKDGARSGDALVLTKPLGTGIAMSAYAQGACPAALWTLVETSMLSSNRHAAREALLVGAKAATDVTGFGFAVTALEMARASKLQVQFTDALPVFPGVLALYASPLRPSLWASNREHARELGLDRASNSPVLFDPQTSGGLLVALPQRTAAKFAADVDGFVIGEFR